MLGESELYVNIGRYTTELLLLLVGCPSGLACLVNNANRFLTKELVLRDWVKGSAAKTMMPKLLSVRDHFPPRAEIPDNVSHRLQPEKKWQNSLRHTFFEAIRSGVKAKYETDCSRKPDSSWLDPKIFAEGSFRELLALRFSTEAISTLIWTAELDPDVYTNQQKSGGQPAEKKSFAVPRLESIFTRWKDMRSQMVRSQLRLVVSIARKYCKRNFPVGDLVQEGNVGLLRAIDKFERQKGVRFSTYAAWWVRQSVTRFVMRSQMVRPQPFGIEVPTKPQKLTEDEVSQPTEEIMIGHLVRPNWRHRLGPSVSTAELPSGIELGPHLQLPVSKILGPLSERESRIIRLRFGLGTEGNHTLEEIGRQLEVTRERVRQIEAQALKKLRHSETLRLRCPRLSDQVSGGL